MFTTYFEQYICQYIPLSEVIESEEEIFWKSGPAKQIIARIIYNILRIQYLLFILFIILCEMILLWLSLLPLIQNFEVGSFIFFIIIILLLNGFLIYLIRSFFKLKELDVKSLQYSEYALTNQKLYLKLTRTPLIKKGSPLTCKIYIINLSLIEAIKFYKSFWDRWYKETGSFRIKIKKPYHSITLKHLPHPEAAMSAIVQTLNSLQNKKR